MGTGGHKQSLFCNVLPCGPVWTHTRPYSIFESERVTFRPSWKHRDYIYITCCLELSVAAAAAVGRAATFCSVCGTGQFCTRDCSGFAPTCTRLSKPVALTLQSSWTLSARTVRGFPQPQLSWNGRAVMRLFRRGPLGRDPVPGLCPCPCPVPRVFMVSNLTSGSTD